MMMNPESYYEEHLKGKTKEQIMTTIRGLKQEIGRLKNTIECPGSSVNLIRHPSEDTRIHWKRKYLERAKQAYTEAGGSYPLSKSEERMADFDTNIDSICKITFSIGGYLSYVVELSDKLKAYTKSANEQAVLLPNGDSQKAFTKDTFMVVLKDLHIGEWRKRYSTKRFGYTVLDGTQWELEFEYSNGHQTVRFEGDNSYPYNFDKFQRLFGIDGEDEDE